MSDSGICETIELSKPELLLVAPVVSVVMLAYNHAPYIVEAIEGVLAQRCPFPFELIIAEDRSKDETLAKCRPYVESHPERVRILTSAQNVGMMPNLFRALDRCRGEYIAFCEGDDFWCDPDKLSLQVTAFDDPDVGLVHTNYAHHTLIDGVWQRGKAGFHDGRSLDELAGDVFGANMRQLMPRTCTSIYRRAAIEQFRANPLANPDFVVGDVPMVLSCAANWKVAYLDRITAVYRIAPGSVTRSGMASTARIMDGLVAIHTELAKLYGHRADFDRAALLPFCISHAKAAFRLGDRDQFDRAVSRIEAMKPGYSRLPSLRARRMLLEVPPLARLANMALDSWRRI